MVARISGRSWIVCLLFVAACASSPPVEPPVLPIDQTAVCRAIELGRRTEPVSRWLAGVDPATVRDDQAAFALAADAGAAVAEPDVAAALAALGDLNRRIAALIAADSLDEEALAQLVIRRGDSTIVAPLERAAVRCRSG